jgi:integrase
VINPTTGLELPAVRGRRDRIATPAQAAALIAALPETERALRATAFYAGLRLGELQALRDSDVDLAAGVIHVQRSWDKVAGPIAPKSRAGVRKVPIVSVLRVHLAERRLRARAKDFFFGDDGPFNDDTARARATKAWKQANLEPIGFQDARHTRQSQSRSIATDTCSQGMRMRLLTSSIATSLARPLAHRGPNCSS